MLSTLHTLKQEYSNKKKYIWNINRDSMDIFSRAAFMGIDVQGFISPEEEYVGEFYMHRPVIALNQIVPDSESVVLVADEVPENIVSKIPLVQRVYWKDSLEIRKEIQIGKNIIYGIGKKTEHLCKMLEDKGIETNLFCVTNLESNELYQGRKIIGVAELNAYESYAVIIAAKAPISIDEILEELAGFQGSVYMELMDILDIRDDLLNLVQNIDLAIKEDRDIYLYSQKNMMARLIEKTLEIYDIRVTGYVYDISHGVQCGGGGVIDIHEWDYVSVARKLIIINERVPESIIRARNNIEHMGFSLEQANFTSVSRYTHADEWMMSKWQWSNDPLVGKTTVYSQGESGWKQYGKNESQIRILILGNSTSSEVFHPENWVKKLYAKLIEQNIEVVIYNGSNICDDIVSEILRFLRDAYLLKPHIVISMSGINNTYYKKSVNQFNEEKLIWKMLNGTYYSGVKSDESMFSFWKRNMKILKLVSQFYGASFFGFLQPMNITMKHMNLREKSLYEQEVRIIGAESFSLCADIDDEEEDYINLMRLFEHQDEMYVDVCHYTNQGHAMIADEVYSTIKSTLAELVKQKEG